MAGNWIGWRKYITKLLNFKANIFKKIFYSGLFREYIRYFKYAAISNIRYFEYAAISLLSIAR